MVGTRRGERRGDDRPSGKAASVASTNVKRRSSRQKIATPGTMATPNNVLDLLPDSGEATRVGKKRSRTSRGDTGSGAQPRTRRALAPSPPPGTAITDLTKECLAAVFRHCSPQKCRQVLPLVCKQWAEVLMGPCDAWKTMVVDKRFEVSELRDTAAAEAIFGTTTAAADAAAASPLGVRALVWARKRALGVKHLAVGSLGVVKDDDNDKSNKTRWLHRLIDLAAPSLTSLAVGTAQRADGYSLKWLDIHRVFPSKGLRSLAVRGVNDGPLTTAAIAPLATLPALRELTLSWWSSREDTVLPPALFTLTSLRRLTLSSLSFSGALPRAITRLQRLEALAIEEADLSSLPEDFSKLSALSKLSLARTSGTLLTRNSTWETLAWLPALVDLDVSNSKIRRLDSLTNTDAFDAKGATTFRSLERLDLSGNALGPSLTIPMAVSDMYLKQLALNRCNLSVIPENSLPDCEGLEKVELADNALVDIPASMNELEYLEELNVAGNPFPAVPEAIRTSASLRRVDLRRCAYLECATSLAGMVKSAPKLEELRMEKEDAGMFQESTKEWLREADAAFKAAGRGSVLHW